MDKPIPFPSMGVASYVVLVYRLTSFMCPKDSSRLLSLRLKRYATLDTGE